MEATKIRTLQQLFAIWDRLEDMAEDIGTTAWTVDKWRNRGRIPPAHWDSVTKAAKRHGRNVPVSLLVRLHAAPQSFRRRKSLSSAVG